jgi:membrane protease YdiL (CAAX protease family)
MTATDAPPPAPVRPWGYLSTFGWVVVAHLIGTAAGFAAVYAWKPDSINALSDFEAILKDGWFFVLSTLAAAPVMIAILFGAVRLRRWTLRDYLALNWPNQREVVIALVALAIFLPALDGVAWLAGQPIVTPFQTEIYLSAQRAGTLPLLWIALVVAAPVWEEIAFRGFIFRSWVRSPQSALPGILAVSALFALLHLQYNWFGMLQVFAVGLLLGWSRWRSGSTYMTIVMHAIVNFYSTVQTVVKLHWLS